MKVIGSGFGRTGTSSMKKALEILGFGPCYHMYELQKKPHHIRHWYKLARGEDVDLDKIFGRYNSSLDFFACIYYKELFEKYPDAKVLHTVRDSPEKWYNSTMNTIYPAKDIIPRITKWLLPPVGRLMYAIETLIWERVFHNKFEDKEYAMKVYEDWTEEVKRSIPEDRLLIFNVKEGWGPLCKFLDVPEPDIPFPHINDTKSMNRNFKLAKIAAHLFPVALLGGISWLIYSLF